MNQRLEELVEDIDISEAECLNKILSYVDELRLRDDEFMEYLISKLDQMVISWEQPWYQETQCLTRCLNTKDLEADKSYRTDRFTKEEGERVEKNWKKFRKQFDVPDTPICLARYKSQKHGRMPNTPQERVRHFVTSFLARGLQRTLSQVYTQFLTLYGYVQSGTYSEIEEKVVKICMGHCHDKAGPILTYILGRHPRQVYNKMKQYSETKNSVKKEYPEFGRWTLKRASKLLKLLLKETRLELSDLKYRHIDRSIWLKLEEKLQHPLEYLRNFWYKKLHVQIFVKEDLKYNKLRKKIFKKLKFYPYKAWKDIRWKELVKEFPDGCTALFIYTIAVRTFYPDYSQYQEMPLECIIEYALSKIASARKNWRLKRFLVNGNGKLIET